MDEAGAWQPDDRICGDWGTSRLRLFRMRGDHIVARLDGPGIAMLSGAPADALMAALAPWRACGMGAVPIALCGMIGSRGGIVELPYVDCPADAAGWRGQAVRIDVGGHAVTIAPGLAGETPDGTADVMRGEETQIFGALAINPALARGRHAIILPGTHSKWAVVADGRVTGFQTFPTGELFGLLRDRSTLTRAGADTDGGEAGFADGLARSDSGGLIGALFGARSLQLRAGRLHGWAVGYLSGLTIGHEVREGLAMLDGTDRLMLIGDPGLTALYERALARHGRTAAVLDGSDAALAGLRLLAMP